ncbi:MAG: hypothetical protein JWN44_4416 [Myxococcales bacterium]|nr:hypothetical protein [Myxococcales bacterium]
MRTRFGSFAIMVLVAGTAAVETGCDDLSTGRPADPAGAPRLVRVLIQDSTFVGGPPAQRGSVVDLLDTGPPTSCSDVNPCVTQYLIAQATPPLECSAPTAGVCFDPLKLPAAGVPLNNGATHIRLVFNKLLSSDIETVMVDPNGAPLPGMPYALEPGLVELIGPDGKAVAGTTAVWDNAGSPEFTSDIILIPFGPAILITPGDLAPSASYTIRIHPSSIKDRAGNRPADVNGVALADPTDFKFTTEPITPNPDASFPSFAVTPSEIAPNDILQLAFWTSINEKTVALTISGPAGFDPAAVEAFADRGSSPKAKDCSANKNNGLLDIAYTSGSGATRAAADWPSGDYTLGFTVKDLSSGAATYTSPTLQFTVTGAATNPMDDANAAANHVLPEQCL